MTRSPSLLFAAPCSMALLPTLALLGLVACEYVDPDLVDEDYVPEDHTGGEDDGGGEADGGGDDGTPPVDEGLDLGCAEMEITWELEPAWSTGHWAWDIVVGRTADGNGDGVITLADSIELFSYTGDESGHFIDRFDYLEDPSTAERFIDGARMAWSRAGDVDGSPGVEVSIGWSVQGDDFHRLTVAGEHAEVEHELPDNRSAQPWIADVDGDGDLDLVQVGMAVDAADGTQVLSWPMTDNNAFSVAVDLDLDGSVELLTNSKRDGIVSVGILGDDGFVQPCLEIDNWYVTMFAVGELDGDPEGEFVIATHGELAVCDSDGTLLHHAEVELHQHSMVAIADLDGDLDAEIVVSGSFAADPYRYPIRAYDHELGLLWEDDREGWSPFSIADLDADGDHEILQLDHDDGLRILDGDGSLVTAWPLPEGVYLTGWQAQPFVVDIDLDGLGEIVVPLSESVVLDTSAGGFPAPGAVYGWSGKDHFPGLLAADGTVNTTGAPWLTPGGNAWQGHGTCVKTGD